LSNSDDPTGCLIVIFVAAIAWAWLPANTLTKAWQAFSNGTPYSHVQIADRPHDCDFLTAPLGSKNCHYKKAISKVMWATSSAGYPIRSLDEGTTWTRRLPGRCDFDATQECPNVFDPPPNVHVPQHPTVTGVIIEWEKVGD